MSTQIKADLAASFQKIAVETVVDKTLLAYHKLQPASVVIAGGVACNQYLRQLLRTKLPIALEYAPPALCTDNGAMIACLACHQAMLQKPAIDPLKLTIEPSLSM